MYNGLLPLGLRVRLRRLVRNGPSAQFKKGDVISPIITTPLWRIATETQILRCDGGVGGISTKDFGNPTTIDTALKRPIIRLAQANRAFIHLPYCAPKGYGNQYIAKYSIWFVPIRVIIFN